MRVPYGELKSLFEAILVKKGFTPEKAGVAAGVFADNSCDGVASHGLNRFPRFVSYIECGSVDPKAEPELEAAFGALERWNGNLGVGCTNAAFGITRAMELAAQHGIGCVAMRNTNHWMRGGTYGLMAARAGYAAICWTNTTANVPAWGAKSCNVGNNPLVMAYPGPEGPMVMDGALAQYSYGALEAAKLDGRELPFPGGFDRDGKMTADPAAILETQRVLPIGLWKGSGYALLLDAIGAALSGGLTVPEVGRRADETALTQVFIAISLDKTNSRDEVSAMGERLLRDFRAAEPAEEGKPFFYPGEKAARTRRENLELGVPVNEEIWNALKAEAAK